MVPHRGTNWAALWLTAQIGRDAVLSESYGRGYLLLLGMVYIPLVCVLVCVPSPPFNRVRDQVPPEPQWAGPKVRAR